MQGSAEMEVAVVTGTFTKWDMNVNACHPFVFN